MHALLGSTDDGFAIFATPAGPNRYQVIAWPELSGVTQGFCVSALKLALFLARRWATAERVGPAWHPDVFVHSLTEDEIRSLNVAAELPVAA